MSSMRSKTYGFAIIFRTVEPVSDIVRLKHSGNAMKFAYCRKADTAVVVVLPRFLLVSSSTFNPIRVISVLYGDG